ncbi:MAG: MmcQ/YjbR family DNA-binding protein [Acidobacteria bacterium]|nr:MmcQ/YjbR family DNA-binding protein [Acidobacteriota bacterium]
MSKAGLSFDTVREIGLEMTGVEEGMSYGLPALKVDGRLVACVPGHKSAEAGSLVVSMDFEQRAALMEEMPEAFYLPEHYRNYPFLLVRLGQINVEQLRGLLKSACRVVQAQGRRKGERKK